MNRLQRIESSRFLGREFLLWLWYASEQNGGIFTLPDQGETEVLFEDKIVLEPVGGEGHRHMLSGVDPTTSFEAALALQINKIPSEVKLKVVLQSRAWAFTLRGDDLQVRSLKIPEVLSQSDDDRIYERIYLMEEIETILEDLFLQFLLKRTAERWEDVLGEIQGWVKEKNTTLF